jgi:O-antigen ligase
LPQPLPNLETPPLKQTPALRNLSRLLLGGLFSTLLFAPLAFGSTDPWAIFLLELASTTLLVLWLVRQMLLQETTIQTNPLFPPMLGFAALILLQLVFRRSVYRFQTLSEALLYFSYGTLAFLAAQVIRRGSHIRKLALAFTVYGAAVALFAIIQSVSSSGKVYWTWTPLHGGWIYGPYVNHNHYAGLMELLVPIPLVIALSQLSQGKKRILAATAAALMAGTVFLSGSRGGMLALTIEFAVLIGITKIQKRSVPVRLALSASLVAGLGITAWIGGGEITSRLQSIETETRQELAGGMRLSIDRDGLRMFSHHPILGFGLGTFSVAYPEFRTFSTTFFVNEAHNDFIQVLVETGAIGLGLMLWLLVAFYRGAARKVHGWETTANGALALAAIVGCTGLLVHSFLDFNLQVPANAALFYTLATLGAAQIVPESIRRKRSNSLLIEEVWATSA